MIRAVGSAKRRAPDPDALGAVEDATLDFLRAMAQGAVASVVCGDDPRCTGRLASLRERIAQGDVRRAQGRTSSAASFYVRVYSSASRL